MTARLRAAVTGMAALALLVAVVGGLPAVLYHFGGSPIPNSLPGWHELARRLASRDDGSLLLGVVKDSAWLAWLLFTACVLAEAQAAVRGRRAARLRLGGVQAAAAQLVALVALAITAAPPAFALPASAAVLTADDRVLTTAPSRTVTVRTGDCLWSIARRYLGAGDLYPEIARLNYGREMTDGEVFNLRRRCTSSGWP
jgi:hypothetical protein